MAIPDYQSVMLPLLSFAADGGEHRIREAIGLLADRFHLTEQERKELLPSETGVFENRVCWARKYLKSAGLLQNPRWGYFQITDRGRATLAENLATLNVTYLKQFPEFLEYCTGKKPEEAQGPEPPDVLLRTTFAKARNSWFSTALLSAVALTRQQQATDWLLDLIANEQRHSANAHEALCRSAPSAAILDRLRQLGKPCI